MTTQVDSATLAGRYAAAKAEADRKYAEVKELEFDLLTQLRDEFPQQWAEFERTGKGFKAYGLEIKTSRTYDVDAFKAQFGEEMPWLLSREEKVVEKVDGVKARELWKQADLIPRLSKTIVPPRPALSIQK